MNEQITRLSAALADRYRIERELGQGGMATVYLAEDLKHKRRVAVKVLKPELAAVLGGERFVVEITTTASMSHPHILPLFDSGAADGFLFYVMPYIEGETLRDKLNRETQLGIDDAVRIAREVLDALEYAHSRGVIHRDIKPENILMQGGRPMIADFGIALAVSAAAGGRMTETGLSLGTPHYMSPEQATAEKEITGRADIYSLASVLYEMLTGEPPHTGSSAQQIIMKIITEPAAAVTKFRKSVPAHVAAATTKALEKLPADRFTTAREFSEALGNPAFTITGAADLSGSTTRVVTGRTRALHWAIGAGVGALAAVAAFTLLRSPAPAPEVVRFEMNFSPGVRLDIQIDEDAPFAISPDGKHIVFATRDSLNALGPLHIREIGQLGSRAIPGTESGIAPFFSPDGQWIGYATDDDQLRKVSISGGPSITLARNVQSQFAGGHWSDDGFIWYTSSEYRSSRIRATGGESEVIDSGGAGGLFWPHVLPDGGAVLYTNCSSACQSTDLILFDVTTKEKRVLVPGAERGWYLPDGLLLYATTEGTIFAVPFDVKKGEISGAPTVVLDDVRQGETFGFRFAVSASGSMLYLPGTQLSGWQVVEVDRSGREEVIIPEFGFFEAPRWSPTGDRIALSRSTERGESNIWIYDTQSRTLSQLTKQGYDNRPSWSPDGQRVAYFSGADGRADLYWMPADGSGPAERVVKGPDVTGISATSWTPDGTRILFDGPAEDGGSDNNEDIFAVGTGSDRTRQVVLATAANDQDGQVSPDGRWIAYISDEDGSYKIYVRPFLREGGRWLVSTDEAANPLWASNSELTYRDWTTRAMVSAKLDFAASTVRVLGRTKLFEGTAYDFSGQGTAQHDVSRDGKRFLMLRQPQGKSNEIPAVMVLNWTEEVRQRTQQQGARKP